MKEEHIPETTESKLYDNSPKNIDRLFPSFHDFLMRHGKMHGFRHIAFDDILGYSAIDAEGKHIMSELLIPINYFMMPNNYAIKPIE